MDFSVEHDRKGSVGTRRGFIHKALKYAVFVAIVATVLTGAVRIGITRFLSSSRGKALVSDRLGSAIGMPVEVSEIDVGDDRSSFRFRVMDPANPKAEVLNVHSASADVTAADFMTGRVSPSALNLNGVALTLRINANGQMTTPLPALSGENVIFPAIAIKGGHVRIQQEGRPDFVASGVNLTLEPTKSTVTITGQVNDPKWGEWTIHGELQRETGAGWVELTNPNAPIDAELLATIPFAPDNLFDGISIVDRAAVKVHLALNPDHTVQPTAEIQSTFQLFGIPMGKSYRLYTNGKYASFESTK